MRFTVDGHRIEKRIPGCTTRRQKGEAQRAASAIYTQALEGRVTRGRDDRLKPLEVHDLITAADGWLESLAVRDVTAATYQKYAGYWVEQWAHVHDVDETAIKRYSQARLKNVKGKTVRSELSALRGFLSWCADAGLVEAVPPFPKIGLAEGRSWEKRRTRSAAPELSEAECRAIIDALPEVSGRGGWPVRARAVVAYETGLRPTTLEKLRVPEHYSAGADCLRITADIDKEGYAREVPLSAAAREALESVCPDVGLIFGRHRLGPYLDAAATQALSPSKAAVFCAQHFRSAATTRMLERSGNLPGVQYLVGHKHASTTARYVRATKRAAEAVLASVSESGAGVGGSDH